MERYKVKKKLRKRDLGSEDDCIDNIQQSHLSPTNLICPWEQEMNRVQNKCKIFSQFCNVVDGANVLFTMNNIQFCSTFQMFRMNEKFIPKKFGQEKKRGTHIHSIVYSSQINQAMKKSTEFELTKRPRMKNIDI